MTIVLYASTTRHEEWLGPKRYVCVVIHDTEEEFVKAAAKRDYNQPSGYYTTAVGAFHPIDRREKYDKSKKRWVDKTNPHFAGTIRTSVNWVIPDVIVHEVVHAACHIFRLDVRKNVNLGPNCFQNEEWFAYMVGDLTHSVTEELRKAGLPLLY